MKNSPLILLLLAIFAFGCGEQAEQYDYTVTGGHKFLTEITADSTFPYHPLKGKMPRRDSFNNAFYAAAFIDAFEEPNISLRPTANPVFRFIYQCTSNPAYVITISKNEIIIKEGQQLHYLSTKDTLMGAKDDSLLDIFKKRFPIKQGDTTLNTAERNNLDSLVNIYPELLRASYYDSLIRRAYSPLASPFKYKASKKAITEKEFYALFKLINQHGYWKMPYNIRCDNPPTDGCVFSLEGNSATQYNFVKSGTCGGAPLAFDSICHAITKAAGLTGKIKVKEGIFD